MSGKEGKRSKGRRNLYSHSKNVSAIAAATAATSDGTVPKSFQPFGIGLKMNVNDVASELRHTLKPSSDDAERITELMDAPLDLDIPAHAISRGPNPYLDRCMYCNSPRTASQDGDEGLELLDLQLPSNTVISSMTDTQSFSSLKLEIWTCASCRKVAGNFQSFLAENFPQATYDIPLHDKTCVDPLSCSRCLEERDALEKETSELQENWIELRSLVKDLYISEETVLFQEQGEKLQFLIDKLCCRDPHQLFLRLESQVREIVMDMRTSLLVKLKENGYNTPELAHDFTSSLLSYYDQLTKKALLFAQYLGGLSEHLKQFKVTWELLNKHLFHSIAHSDPAISSSGPAILEQLRQGSVQFERSKNDPYCAVRKRLLKFQEEMSVVVVIWRECQQLIENYCQEEVKNTQKQVSSKAKSFISQQRQYLKEHVIKESVMDEALSETMRNLMSGHKSSTERVLCRNCMRERCTCDECTITHMITCGIMNSEKGEIPPLDSSFTFALEHTRNVMNITPPSMSSTTSSSGSVSPINIEDKLSTFYECEQVLKEEFSDALLGCDSRQDQVLNGEPVGDDIDDNAGDDEEEEEDDEDDDVDEDDFPDSQNACSDEPHSLQIPICELKDADALWEAVQQHHQQQLLQHQQFIGSQQSCVHCKQVRHGQQCPFQPRIETELSRQLDVELAKSSLLPGGAGDCGPDTVTNFGEATDDRGNSDSGGGVNPNVCATCQCHACLKQSGHVFSASLPLQIPVTSPPAELHLYPHIHGLPQQHQQHYMLDLPSPLMPPIKLPVKLDFDDHHVGMQDHLSYAYSDWDNSMQPRPGSLAAQHHHQHHQRLSALSSDLPPPPPLVTSVPPFTFDLSHLATHTTHTSTTNTTSAFKSVAGKPLTSSILPTLNNVNHLTSEGSSVDPSRPLDFTTHSKIPQSCLNMANSVPSSSFSPLSFSCPSSTSSPSSTLSAVSMTSMSSKSIGSCRGPPCSRPAPVGGNASSSKWERNQHCRKFNAGNKPLVGVQSQNSQHNMGVLPLTGGMQGPPLSTSPAVLKNLNFTPKRNTQTCSHPLTSRSALTPQPAPSASTTTVPSNVGTSVSLSCSNSISTMVNNIGVGTSTPCNDPECNAHHHDDNCDSVDDSCSEKSSSTSTSNQKEGKYCDCCYCEFFGHSNTQVAKTSTNYIEMKDRLRKKLKKRQSESKHKQGAPKNGYIPESSKEELDPLEKKGLDGLLNFINGTDKDSQIKAREKELTAKAAKRARQKQKKLEEKARQAKSTSPVEKNIQQPEKTLRQILLNQTLNIGNQPGVDPTLNMVQPKSKKPPPPTGKSNSAEEVGLKDARPLLTKQEINRSSLIIESTRSTISLSPKNLEKFAASQQRLLTSNNSESSQHMIQLLNALQQQRHNHQNKNKSANPSSVNNSKNTSTTQTKSNGTVSTPSSAKPSVEGGKANGLAKQQQSDCQQVQQPQQHRHNQQQKQQPLNKVMNGKVPQSSLPGGTSNPITATGCNHVDKQNQQNQPDEHIYLNGKPAKVEAAGISLPTPVTSAAVLAATTKTSLADSPSAGSCSSASQSPSCGTKPAPEQGKANGKGKKNKKKNKNGTIRGVDEIFMPKSESELDGDVDDFERELEEFKRFCFEPAEPKERRKIAVNVNLKDIFKKKTGLV